MQEMVLNHASLLSPDLYSGVVWLDDVIRGMVSTHAQQGG